MCRHWGWFVLLLLFGDNAWSQSVQLFGPMEQWQPLEIRVNGPVRSEAGPDQPFLDIRLDLIFSKNGREIIVPGHFAADGNAAETSADAGSIWRAYFAPDEPGVWRYRIAFHTGPNIALTNDTLNATPLSAHGASGTVSIAPANAILPDLRARGHLRPSGRRHFQFAGDSSYFFAFGPASPDNFLAYPGFDNTFSQTGDTLPAWTPHLIDYLPGANLWQISKGRELFGALNYLADEGLTSFSVLTNNAFGQTQNVWPWLSPVDTFRYDISKLDQWNRILEHAQSQGLTVRMVLEEYENGGLLSDRSRRLYYREMVSRFAHLPGLIWDLSEGNGYFTTKQQQYAFWISALDPYSHPILLTHPIGQEMSVLGNAIGSTPSLHGAGLQVDMDDIHDATLRWLDQSGALGSSWAVFSLLQGPESTGVMADSTYAGQADNQDRVRREALYGNLLAGGSGVGYHFGTVDLQNDLGADDFRSRAGAWRDARLAKELVDRVGNWVEYENMDDRVLSMNGWCLGRANAGYVCFTLDGSAVTLDLPDSVRYAVRWFDPRQGGTWQTGAVDSVRGPGQVNLGIPPAATDEDWVIVLEEELLTGNGDAQERELAVELVRGNLGEWSLHRVGDSDHHRIEGSLTVKYWDVQGRRLGTISWPASHPILELKTHSLPPGLYLLRISNGERSTVKKMLLN